MKESVKIFIRIAKSIMGLYEEVKSAYEQRSDSRYVLYQLEREVKAVVERLNKARVAKQPYDRASRKNERAVQEIKRLEKAIKKRRRRSDRKKFRTERPYLEYELANESYYLVAVDDYWQLCEEAMNLKCEIDACLEKIRELNIRIRKTKETIQDATSVIDKNRRWNDALFIAACDVLELSEAEKADATIFCRPVGRAGTFSARLIYGNDGDTHGHAEINCMNGDIIYHRPPGAPRGPQNFSEAYRNNPDFFIDDDY